MNDNNEKYLNVTLKSADEEHEEEQISISIVGILRNLRRFFAIWVSLTIIASVLAMVGTALAKQDSYKKMGSLVSFTYDGVEKGLDPNGNQFDVNSLKNPKIIAKAFEELGIASEKLESVRKNITFEAITQKEEVERQTAYKNIFDAGNSSSFAAIDQLLKKEMYPSTYMVYFDYAPTGLSGTDAATLLNTILEKYSEYFMEVYGYNESLGSPLNAIETEDYDYAETIDVYSDSLYKLTDYIRKVSATELKNSETPNSRFRSSETGYTFPDLQETINTIREIDLNRISSYITVNTITKDKDTLLTKYTYKVESLERSKSVYAENLASVNASIAGYTKNTVMMFGSGTSENMNISAEQSSEEYDKLFRTREELQKNLSETVQQINMYNQRIERVKNSTAVNSQAKMAKVEEDLENLKKQIKDITELVNETTDDFYRTVIFSKAYNILVPANSSYSNATQSAIKDAVMPMAIADALIFVIYFAVSVILSCVEEYTRAHSEEKEKKTEPAAG